MKINCYVRSRADIVSTTKIEILRGIAEFHVGQKEVIEVFGKISQPNSALFSVMDKLAVLCSHLLEKNKALPESLVEIIMPEEIEAAFFDSSRICANIRLALGLPEVLQSPFTTRIVFALTDVR